MQLRGCCRVAAAASAITWLAAGPARADDDPFAVLREPDRAWTFEQVTGRSLDALEPVRDAPRVRCRVAEVAAEPAPPRSVIECAQITSDLAAVLADRFTLVFEPTGVRELRDPAELADRSSTGAFTFPRTLEGRWRFVDAGRRGARVEVRVQAGSRATPWISEATYRPAGRGAPVRSAAGFEPGVGPTLRCTITGTASRTTYACLRALAPATEPAPPKPAPPQVTITGKAAHDKSSLTAATVASKITAAYLPGLRRCYAELLRKKPATRAQLQLDFTVDAVGKLAGPRAATSDDGLAECARGAMAGWRFAIPMSEYGEPRNAQFVIDLKLTPGG